MVNLDYATPHIKFYAGVNGNFSCSWAFGIGERIDGLYSNESIILELPTYKFVDALIVRDDPNFEQNLELYVCKHLKMLNMPSAN
jgi:hypothetical protein